MTSAPPPPASFALPQSVRYRLRIMLNFTARHRLWAIYVAVLLLVIIGATVPEGKRSVVAGLERRAFDLQMTLLRKLAPRPIENDVVLIGIDDTTEARFAEPLSLWHIHYAKVLDALRLAKPQAVGVDIVLPVQSYSKYLPGSDLALARSIFLLQKETHLVYVSGTDARGAPVQPLPIYARWLKQDTQFGTDQQIRDVDEYARRFSEQDLGQTGAIKTFPGQILRGIGKPVQEGLIDYSVGGPVRMTLMQNVIDWAEQGNEARLREWFGGRIVLFGTFSTERDRWKLPVKLGTWELRDKEFEAGQPGVVLHMQVLRSHLANGLIQPVPTLLGVLLCLVVASAVFLRFRVWLVLAGVVLLPATLLAINLLLIRQAQSLLPIAAIIATLWLALSLRAVLDAVDSVVERTRLKRSFRGQVSPGVMDEILTGSLEPGSEARTMEVCVIFSDIRGFTTLSEAMAPDQVMNVLQRYFDRMVRSVHRFDGTIDKFIGDGMMILFGAPRPTADPCTDAVRCALDMLEELDALNAEFEKEGLPKLVIGIGINFGKVVVGNIGSTERHNYSAIGDAVNVAARIEGQTKELGRRILITETVVTRIGDRFNFEPLGERLVKGHSPVKVWGIRVNRARANGVGPTSGEGVEALPAASAAEKTGPAVPDIQVTGESS